MRISVSVLCVLALTSTSNAASPDNSAVQWVTTQPTYVCKYLADVNNFTALRKNGEVEAALKSYDCILLDANAKVSRLPNDGLPYEHIGAHAADGRIISVWAAGDTLLGFYNLH